MNDRVTVRWVGDPMSVVAGLEALGYPSMQEIDDGTIPRMLKVPPDRVEQVRAAIRDEGGRVLADASTF